MEQLPKTWSVTVAECFVRLFGVASSIQHTQLIPDTVWRNHHPWPLMCGLRHLMYVAQTNSFNKLPDKSVATPSPMKPYFPNGQKL